MTPPVLNDQSLLSCATLVVERIVSPLAEVRCGSCRYIGQSCPPGTRLAACAEAPGKSPSARKSSASVGMALVKLQSDMFWFIDLSPRYAFGVGTPRCGEPPFPRRDGEFFERAQNDRWFRARRSPASAWEVAHSHLCVGVACFCPLIQNLGIDHGSARF